MEPNRVVETGTEEPILLRVGCDRVGAYDSVGREVVREVREPGTMQELCRRITRIAEVLIDLHPCHRTTGANSAGDTITHLARRDRCAVECVSPRRLLQSISLGNIGHGNGLHDCCQLGSLERTLRIENCTDCLARNHTASRKRATIANAIDFVANRLARVALSNEIRADRVRFKVQIHRQRCSMQCLRHDLPTIETAPRILRARADKDIGAMGRKFEQDRKTYCRIHQIPYKEIYSFKMEDGKSPKSPMSDEHKAALAKGRAEGRIVREYLEGLRATKPKRGRKRTPDTIAARLQKLEVELAAASPLDELLLVQERRDLSAELDAMSSTIDMTSLEAAFVSIAKSYSESKKISYQSWRDVGVDASVLKSAGVSRGD